METILLALLGYWLAKIQYADPFVFKMGVGLVLFLAALNWIGELAVKIVFRLLADKNK
jgi:hypothetical protein